MNPLLETLLRGLPASDRERYRAVLAERHDGRTHADGHVGRPEDSRDGRSRAVTPEGTGHEGPRYVIAVAYELGGRWQATVPGVADLVVSAATKGELSGATALALAEREGRDASDYVVHVSST